MPSTMRRTFGFVIASIAVPLALYACANDDYTAPGPKPAVANEAATTSEAGDASVVDAPNDQAVLPVRCTAAELSAAAGDAGGDNTATTTPLEVGFPTLAGPDQYTNQCLKVKVGAVVTFKGSFTFHPLRPSGGDTPTPIPALTNSGDSLPVTMANAGTYGYECVFHQGTMFGAIQAVP